MDIAFKFMALNSADNQLKGIIYGPTSNIVWHKLKKAGLRPQKLVLDPVSTLTGLISTDFDQHDLAMFYDTIGKRILTGRPLGEGLDSAATFILDPRLRQASLLTAQSVMDGAPMSSAMQTAGFSIRDCMAIRAAENSGRQGEAFIAMGGDVSRRAMLTSKLKVMFAMPIIMITGMYAAVWASAFYMIPKIMKFAGALGPQAMKSMESPAQLMMFGLSDWTHSQTAFSLMVWTAIPLTIFILWQKGVIAELADYIKSWKEISEKSDMASSWTAFAMLYEAGVTPFEAARTVKPSAKRVHTQRMFGLLDKSFLSGYMVDEAVRRSEFPEYIVTSMKAAASAGSPLPDEIKAMCQRLQSDVELMTTRFQKKMEFWSLVLLGVMAMVFFSATIGPLMKFGFQNV